MLRPSCLVCGNNDHTPRNFLLTCSICSTAYHHRCHVPVILDHVLLGLIRAYNAQDHANSFSSWKCSRCLSDKPIVMEDEDVEIIDSYLPGRHTKSIDDQVVDLTISDSEASVKPEDATVPLPPKPKYNTAPTWIQDRYSKAQVPDAWDRLLAKKALHLQRRPIKSPAKPLSAAHNEDFMLVARTWLLERVNGE